LENDTARYAFEDISFTISEGTAWLIGPNGSGKSTLLGYFPRIESDSGVVAVRRHTG